MDNINIIKKRLSESIELKNTILQSSTTIEQVNRIVQVFVDCFKNNCTVWFCGNGGSAADAQHLAAEFSGRYYYNRPPLASEALHVNTSYLTAVANDYGYDEVYVRLIQALGKKNDVLVGLTTSGKSKNIINALKQAKSKGIITVTFTGCYINEIKPFSDYIISIPSEDTPRIQELHIFIGHIICELVEKTLFPQ